MQVKGSDRQTEKCSVHGRERGLEEGGQSARAFTECACRCRPCSRQGDVNPSAVFACCCILNSHFLKGCLQIFLHSVNGSSCSTPAASTVL